MTELRRNEFRVHDVPLRIGQRLVRVLHYSKGAANTATYLHGLFRVNSFECLGVAWWIPPTRAAAESSYPLNWKGVLALSRLVIHPDVPKNGASFLLARSMRLIDRQTWPCLVTYADDWQGHTGAIYRAANWEYCGKTKPERVYSRDGRMIARKAGPKTRTHAEMINLGAVMVGSFAKHKFRHIVSPRKTSKPLNPAQANLFEHGNQNAN